MPDTIYGVDLNSTITPLMVRDAIVRCFWEAHCMDTGLGKEEAEINKSYCKTIVEKAFKDANGNFDNPTKEDIQNCTKALAGFSKNFRDPSIIEKHYNEIMRLVEKL